MHERLVDVPRLYATVEEDGPTPEGVSAMRRALLLRYGIWTQTSPRSPHGVSLFSSRSGKR